MIPEPLQPTSHSNKNSLTLKKIEKLHEKDLQKFDKKFHPKDLIDQNDTEDNFYLADYDINKETPIENEKTNETKIDEKAR